LGFFSAAGENFGGFYPPINDFPLRNQYLLLPSPVTSFVNDPFGIEYDEILEVWDGMGRDFFKCGMGWDGMRFFNSGMGWDGTRFFHWDGMGWDEIFLSLVWDGMGRDF